MALRLGGIPSQRSAGKESAPCALHLSHKELRVTFGDDQEQGFLVSLVSAESTLVT